MIQGGDFTRGNVGSLALFLCERGGGKFFSALVWQSIALMKVNFLVSVGLQGTGGKSIYGSSFEDENFACMQPSF